MHHRNDYCHIDFYSIKDPERELADKCTTRTAMNHWISVRIFQNTVQSCAYAIKKIMTQPLAL